MNTIQLNLLDNKTIAAYVNGYSYAYEGGYHIIAGEQNATRFEIVSVPQQYKDATFSIEAINARRKVVDIKLEDNAFILPAGMAVAGYGQLLISCVYMHRVDGEYIEENVFWLPLKLKVWNTRPDWEENSISITQETLDRLKQAESDINELQEKIENINFEASGGAQELIAGENIKIKNNIISVLTTDNAEEDNTRPITASGVYTIVGNIDVLLKTI